MKIQVALSLFILAIAGSGAFAQDAVPAPSAPQTSSADPEKITVATKILEETHTQNTMTALLNLMTPQMLAGIKQQMPTISEDTLKLISQMLPDEMKAELPKLVTMEAEVYASHFTLAELKALDAFYQTEVGQKVISETPKILRETVPLGMVWGRQAGMTAMQHVIDKLRAQGVKI
jgi:uncharacterized protein